MELRFEPTTQNTNDSKPASTMPAYPIVCVLPYILPAAFIFCRFNLRCPRFSHSPPIHPQPFAVHLSYCFFAFEEILAKL